MADRFRMLPSYHYEDNTDGNLLKSVGKPLRDYKIEGNCFQDGTPSPDNPIDIQCCGEKTVNLIDFKGYLGQELPYTKSQYGMSVIYNKDGSLTLSGTSTASHDAIDFYFFDIKYMEPGTYTLSGVSWSDSHNLFGQYYENGERIAKYVNNKTEDSTATFTIEENQGIYFTIRCLRKFVDVENLIMKPQLQKGNTSTAYEPYGYKVPVTVGGKNILPVNDFKGTVNWGQGHDTVHAKVEPNTQYFFTFQESNRLDEGVGNVILYCYSDEFLTKNVYAPVVLKAGENTTHSTLTGFKTGDYTDLYMKFRSPSGNAIKFETKGLMLTKERGVPYEPYIPPQTYNIYLDEPLRKVGDYADYVDFKNGKVVRNVANVSLNGRTYILQRKDNETDFYYCLIANPKPIASKVYCLCNAFNKTYISGVNTNIGIDPYSMGVIRMRPDLSVYDTLEKWQEYTNNNELYVIYPVEALEQPITLPQILTEKHTNIISVGTTLQPSEVNYQYYKGGK